MTNMIQKLIVVPGDNVDTNMEAGRVALFNPDGTPYVSPGAGPVPSSNVTLTVDEAAGTFTLTVD